MSQTLRLPFKSSVAPSPELFNSVANDDSRIIQLEEVDLDVHSKPEAIGRLKRFLEDNRIELALEQERDVVAAWLHRVWPEQALGEALITKLPPKEGRHYWQIRPPWQDSPDAPKVAAGSQVPAFGVIVRDGKLVLQWFEQALHRAPRFYKP